MDTHFSLSWDAYQNNICRGLSLLQQRGEYVDMTLAADGHHVKVHQMVLSLVSPYIKDIISSAQCPHPVIFLNNISHTTLSSVLEYIYTGEVRVPQENLSDLLAAGKALHIRGLQEMADTKVLEEDTTILPDNTNILKDDTSIQTTDDEKPTLGKKTLVEQLQKCKENKKFGTKRKGQDPPIPPLCKIFVTDDSNIEFVEESTEVGNDSQENGEKLKPIVNALDIYKSKELMGNSNNVQYSLSNQGGLQLIFNRYIYVLKYVQKKLIKFWRCAESGTNKCRANIYTNEKNQVIRRTFNHNHPFHDKNILKKMDLGLIFAAYNEAESKARYKTVEEDKRPRSTVPEYTDSE